VKGALLLDVVIRKSSAILELLPGEDQSLLVGRDPFLVLDFGLDILNRVAGLDLEGDGLAGQSLHKDLHPAAESQDQVKGALLLDVVIRKSSAILELLPGEDQSLLVGRDPFLVLDFGFDVLNRVTGLNLQGDGFAGQSLHEDLHTAAESEDEMEGAFLLDVVIGKSSAVLELLPGEDESLLVGRDPFLVLDLGLDILDGVTGLDLEGDGLAGQSLDKDLHAATESEDQVKGALLLDVVVRQSPAVLELLPGEDQPLLVGRNALFVLDLGLDVLNGVAGLNFEGDGLASQSLHKYLHLGFC